MPLWDDVRGHGTEEEWAFKSRTYTGQVKDIQAEDGKLTVELIGTREKYVVDAPVVGLSVRGIQSSWQRHMPQVNDFADIAFDANNRPRLVRMTSWKGGNDSGGWADISRAGRDGRGSLNLIWRTLKQGEFDLRSAGGAGYYFTADGHAVLEAGPTVIELDKNRSESFGNAGLWVRRGGAVELRYGDVKRLLPGTFEETSVGLAPGQLPPSPTVAGAKEWKRTLSVQLAPSPAPPLNIEVEEIGDVRDDVGVPVPGPNGVPLRYRRRFYDATGFVEALKVEVDALGNVKVTQNDIAVPGGVEVIGGALSPLHTSFFTGLHETTTSMELSAGTTLDLGGTAGVNINAGGAADSEMVRGTELATYLLTKLSVLTAFGPSGPAIVPLAPGVELSLLGRVK